MRPRLSDLAKSDYVDRVNRVLDHIHTNLAAPLRLEDLAAVAHFSPFHFHRVFKSVVGEPLNAFVRRVRLDRTLYLMSHTAKTLTEIAHEVGFASSSDFSRAFRGRFGVPPSVFDLAAHRRDKRDELFADGPIVGLANPTQNPDGFDVRVVEQPARRVAYLRVWQPFQAGRVEAAARRLVEIASWHNFADGQWLGYMWEDPEITPHDECRYDVAVEVDTGFESPVDEVGVQDFAATSLAEIAIAGDITLEQRALDWLFGGWLPDSGYVPDQQPVFEAWEGLPYADGSEHFELCVQLPVRRG